MRKITMLCVLLAGCVQAPEPAAAPVAVAPAKPVPQQSLEDFDPFPAQPAPSKVEYIADQDAIAAFNREQLAKRAAEDARSDAEWEADRRTDRIVQAQQETQQAVRDLKDEISQ